MDPEICFRSVSDLANLIRTGEVSAVAVVDAFLDRIEARNETTNAYVDVYESAAREAAMRAEEQVTTGTDLGPLHGVPVAIKDLVPVAEHTTTYGSVPLSDHVSDHDAPVVERLRDAGAIILGKTNTSEFGHIAVTDNELFGPTGTPFDPSKTAGGSSGGSAAAVADGLAPFAIGTDAGGSVRIPASACGVFGIKPTFGRVPREVRPDFTLDVNPFTCTGPLTRSVEDAVLVLNVISGVHECDPFSTPTSNLSRFEDESPDIPAVSVAYSPDLGCFSIDPGIRSYLDSIIQTINSQGFSIHRDAPDVAGDWDALREASFTIFQARMAAVIAGSKRAFGVDLSTNIDSLTYSLRAMVERGREFTVTDLSEANGTRSVIFDAVTTFFDTYDILLTPTLAVPPFDKNEIGPDEIDGTEVNKYTDWYLTQLFNMTGHPAASLPVGQTDTGLPIGLQIAGKRHTDDLVLTVAHAIESILNTPDLYPP